MKILRFEKTHTGQILHTASAVGHGARPPHIRQSHPIIRCNATRHTDCQMLSELRCMRHQKQHAAGTDIQDERHPFVNRHDVLTDHLAESECTALHDSHPCVALVLPESPQPVA